MYSIRLTDINHNNTIAEEERRHHEISVPTICRLAFVSRKEENGDEEDFEYGEDDGHVRTLYSSILGKVFRPVNFGFLHAIHFRNFVFHSTEVKPGVLQSLRRGGTSRSIMAEQLLRNAPPGRQWKDIWAAVEHNIFYPNQ